MIVVADSGPLRYLLVIGHIDILPPLFDRVLIPAAVRQELTHPRAPALVRNWLENALRGSKSIRRLNLAILRLMPWMSVSNKQSRLPCR
jgi:predicted nucleic acid-binding protein